MDMTKLAEFSSPLLSALFGAPGWWAFVQSKTKDKTENNDDAAKLLLGVSKNQLITLGRTYIERGYITMDEYEEYEAEYKLYSAVGGNGLARRVFKQVDNLPIMPNNIDGRKTL